MHTEYYALGTERAGDWNTTDMVMGGLMTVLVLEYARKRHMPLFVLNIVLMLYAVYGYVVPGMFHHAGLSWFRVVTAMSVETTTGVFSNLPQIALTVVGAFLLVLSVLSRLRLHRIRSCAPPSASPSARAHALPQSAVIGSMCVGTVSGSGAANAITIGSATIPAMIGAGMPPATAAAIEVGVLARRPIDAAGDGRRGLPDGRVSRQELFRRGRARLRAGADLLRHRRRLGVSAGAAPPHAPGGRALSDAVVARHRQPRGLPAGHLRPGRDDGGMESGAEFAALYVFVAVGGIPAAWSMSCRVLAGPWSLAEFIRPVRKFLESYIEMTSDLTLLLATLAIMTGALVITGVPTKLGAILIEAAGVNLAAMVVLAFLFGALLGTGLPPAPTYILVAIVIAPPMIKVGVNPWVVHFFAFFLGVWGELTPPTSLVAAVTAKIANASFYTTLNRALQICVSLFTLMAGVFVHPDLVIEPGVAQLTAGLLILVATIGITFSLQAHFADSVSADSRLPAGARRFVALWCCCIPTNGSAPRPAVPVLLIIGYWLISSGARPAAGELTSRCRPKRCWPCRCRRSSTPSAAGCSSRAAYFGSANGSAASSGICARNTLSVIEIIA